MFNHRYGSNGKPIYNEDYIKLYVETIKTEFNKILENGIFMISSPSNGLKTEKDGGISKNPYDQLYGDGKYIDMKIECKSIPVDFKNLLIECQYLDPIFKNDMFKNFRNIPENFLENKIDFLSTRCNFDQKFLSIYFHFLLFIIYFQL